MTNDTTPRPTARPDENVSLAQADANGADMKLSTRADAECNHYDLAVLAASVAASVPRFSTIPEVLLEQAQRIEVWGVPQSNVEANDRAAMTSYDLRDASQPTHLLLLARDTRSAEIIDGCELVAYPCDMTGHVSSWSHRYSVHGLNFNLAAQKLRFQIVNDLAEMRHVEC
ncbi:MAG TPA: hypothetical protein VF719_00800 [Abditibacteriaceae bacterium]|jgi:hypothetical protein